MSAVLTLAAVFVGKGRNGYMEESRLPLTQPLQKETTAMIIGDQVEVCTGDKLVLPVEKTTTFLCVLCDVAIPLLLLQVERRRVPTRTSSSRALSMRRSIGSESKPETGESSQWTRFSFRFRNTREPYDRQGGMVSTSPN